MNVPATLSASVVALTAFALTAANASTIGSATSGAGSGRTFQSSEEPPDPCVTADCKNGLHPRGNRFTPYSQTGGAGAGKVRIVGGGHVTPDLNPQPLPPGVRGPVHGGNIQPAASGKHFRTTIVNTPPNGNGNPQ